MNNWKTRLITRFLKLLYGPALCIYSVVYLPKLLMRLGQASDKKKMLCGRFGFVQNPLSGRNPIWIHAVSVGEVLATKELIRILQVAHPDVQIVLTTTTPTGQNLAKKMESESLCVTYFPLDFGFAIRRFLKTFKPKCMIIMETEIWPNLIREVSRSKIPTAIVNGRISDRAMKRYEWIRNWFGELLRQLEFVSVCSVVDRDRFLKIGAEADKVIVTGNMKFDIEADRNAIQVEVLRKRLAVQGELILVAGSTHAGEEEMILRVFHRIKKSGKRLKLILAPRHIERVSSLRKSCEVFTDLTVSLVSANGVLGSDVVILDTMGELSKFYGIADLVFIGGSLIPHGGQNPIEPARERRAILHGPFVHNFRDVYLQLDEMNGAMLVKNEFELYERINELMNNESNRNALGMQAFDVVDRLRGASQRNLALLEPWLQNVGVKA